MAKQAKAIYFYSHRREPYGFLSNFYDSPLRIEGKIYPTSEHYFQAMKFHSHPDLVEAVRSCETPEQAKAMGGRRTLPCRRDWGHVRDDVMRAAISAKFEQHEELWWRLRQTQGAMLVEHTHNDSYWADGGDGSGVNMLGKLLVEYRDGRIAKEKEAHKKQQDQTQEPQIILQPQQNSIESPFAKDDSLLHSIFSSTSRGIA